jgi:hypothetical protein
VEPVISAVVGAVIRVGNAIAMVAATLLPRAAFGVPVAGAMLLPSGPLLLLPVTLPLRSRS